MWPIGHDRSVSMLRHAMATDHVSHAYLFTGPERVGKTTLALAFAQALNCTGPEPPCGQCHSCQLIATGRHPDVRLIHAVAKENSDRGEEVRQRSKLAGRQIQIHAIQEMQHDASLHAYQGRRKVYIIQDADDMNPEAQNCLLKTLEEPPPAVVLILTTANASMLLPTVASRCQQLSFSLVAAEEAERALCDRWGVERQRAHRLARICAGHFGWAVEAVQDPEVEAERMRQLEMLRQLFGATHCDRFAVAERLAGQTADAVARTLDCWLGWWRDLLLVKSGCGELASNIDCAEELARLAERWTFEQIHAFIGSIHTTRQYLSQNVNLRLALEVMLLDLPSPLSLSCPRPGSHRGAASNRSALAR